MSGGLSFDGVNLDVRETYLVNRGETFLPPIFSRRVALPGHQGEREFESEFRARSFDLEMFVRPAVQTSAALHTAIDNLTAMFEPTRGSKQLIFDLLPDRYFLARAGDTPSIRRAIVSADAFVRMVCADPLAYSTTLSTPSSGSPLLINPAGNYKTFPILDITAPAPFAGNIVVTNSATGESLTWNGSITTGDTLRIETATQRVRKNGALVMSGLVANSVFFPLYAGVPNSITVAGPGSPSITATYRARWL